MFGGSWARARTHTYSTHTHNLDKLVVTSRKEDVQSLNKPPRLVSWIKLSRPWATVTSHFPVIDGRDAEAVDNAGGRGSVRAGVPGNAG